MKTKCSVTLCSESDLGAIKPSFNTLLRVILIPRTQIRTEVEVVQQTSALHPVIRGWTIHRNGIRLGRIREPIHAGLRGSDYKARLRRMLIWQEQLTVQTYMVAGIIKSATLSRYSGHFLQRRELFTGDSTI